ncbi:metallophosphoesterase family protein [Bacillus sp. FJAT-28004]|uniref:metallophosphoesterase family protein n=1 Tax=Bacillus sp. FJAT-28004 TaxID=1679165 RepID=UPI0007C76973|nr:metallophosphoesterase family protein [Bacillus sp. FJAT-28004]
MKGGFNVAEKALSFNQEGTFTIVQFTDVHWTSGGELDLRTQSLMEEVIRSESPDLIVFTGDVIYSDYCENPKLAFLQAVSCAENSEVPWAAVFGNHDSEKGITRQELMELQQTCKFCLSEAGPEHIDGIGNYVIQVYGLQGNPAAALYFLDSGSYAPAPLEGYDWIRRSQIDWYVQNSQKLTTENGAPLPSLAFFHIPLPEYIEVWNEQICHGVKYEDIVPPKINSGFGTAMLEQGDVIGTFVGHDHINDFYGDWHGIRLCYGRSTGYNTYGKSGFSRGARIIRLREGVRDFETWLRLEDNTVELKQPVHHPEAGNSYNAEPPGSSGFEGVTPPEEQWLDAAFAEQGLGLLAQFLQYYHMNRNIVEGEQALQIKERIVGFLLLLQQAAPKDTRIMSKLTDFYHSHGSFPEAGFWYGCLLEQGPQHTVSAELADLVSRLAPELYLVESEPFALQDCVAVIHPEMPLIAYHLFWEDDWNSPNDSMPCDHEIIWVRYDPQTLELSGIWSYFHEYIITTKAALTEAREHQNRPQAYVQWGIHGTLLAGGLNALTVTWKDSVSSITHTGMDAMERMFHDAKKGGKWSKHSLKQGCVKSFTGEFSDYIRFSKKLDTRTYLDKPKRIHKSRWANAVLNQRALTYNAAPKLEWPEEALE